jgi:plasmid stabilization system protein ParE
MDFQVTFSRNELRDLEEIVGFIARDNLIDKALGLNRFPSRHACCPNRNNVGKVPVGPFVIYYRVNIGRGRITILHFWHSARQDPML